MESEQPGLSFVVPVFNEERSIGNTLLRAQKALEGLPIRSEIIVVNDGSTDSSRELAEQAGVARVISHPVNIGYGNAIKTGVKNARYDWVGIVDADGTYPIESIGELVAEMQKNYDMVVATRRNIAEIDGPAKRFSRFCFTALVRFLNDARIEDPNSGFRIFKRDLVLKLLPFLCGTFSFTTSLTILASGLWCFVKYIPVNYEKREGRSKVRHFRDALRTLQFIVQGIIYFNPIKYFVLLVICLLLGVAVPGAVLIAFHQAAWGLGVLIAGTCILILLGMAGLADILRVSSQQKRSIGAAE